MLALDVARIEAGLLLIDVDFHSSRKALIESQKYSPFELGLGRLVDSKQGPVRRPRRARRGTCGAASARQIVGLEVDWTEVEKLYEAVGLPPTAPAAASRVAVPVYKGRTQVGRATSTTWSTTLKKLIALATIDAPHYAIGTTPGNGNDGGSGPPPRHRHRRARRRFSIRRERRRHRLIRDPAI